jgi:hypothetical protein
MLLNRAVLTILILFVAGVSGASGQSKSPAEAPVGHRQPTQGAVGQAADEQSPMDKKLKELDEALAKKLKSICRGC